MDALRSSSLRSVTTFGAGALGRSNAAARGSERQIIEQRRDAFRVADQIVFEHPAHALHCNELDLDLLALVELLLAALEAGGEKAAHQLGADAGARVEVEE